MKLSFRNIFLINFIISVIVIFAVLILQYNFNLPPCDMCIKERYPYYILILFSLFFIYNSKNFKVNFFLLISSCLTILIGTIYTTYHVGIERGVFIGNSACSAIVETSNTNELLTIIQNTPIIRCDEPTIIFNMISLAELNLITMSILLTINLISIIKNVRKK